MRWLRPASLEIPALEGDPTPEFGRSRERFRRIGLTTISALGARGIAFITGFVTVPLTLHYLGAEQYGLWATLSSVIAMATFADFGLGNGLLNALASANGRDDRESAQQQVSSAFFMLLALAAVFGAAFGAVYTHVVWPGVYNVRSPAAQQEAGRATAAFVACFLVGLPLGVVPRIRQGYQEGYWNSLYDALGNLAGLAGVLVAIQFRASLVWLVLAMAGAPVLATGVHALVLLRHHRTWLRLRLGSVHRGVVRRLLQHGLLFFALQLAGALAFAPDNLIIAQTLGAASVTEYAVVVKLFSVSLLLADVALSPLWPAYGEAMARGDFTWVRRTLGRSLWVAVLASVAVAAMLVAGANRILALWVGGDITAPLPLLLGLAVWTILSALGTAAAMYLNAANLMWIQVACSAFMVPASMVLKIVFARRWGVEGVPWAMVLAYAVLMGIPLIVFSRRAALSRRPAAGADA